MLLTASIQLSCRRNSTSSKIHKTEQRLFRCGQRLFSVFLIRLPAGFKIQGSMIHDLCMCIYVHTCIVPNRARKNLHHFYHQHHRSIMDLCRPVNASVLLHTVELYIRLQEAVAEVLADTSQDGQPWIVGSAACSKCSRICAR